MRKVIITVVIGGLIVAAYYWVSKNARLSLSMLQGETAKVFRGDLDIPITASGNINSASVTEIKGKASGEVIEIPFNLGAMVKKGEVVVRLLDVDERRNVEKAKADLARAEIELARAELRKKQMEGSGVAAAEAKVLQADARYLRAKSEYDYKLPHAPTTRSAGAGAPFTPFEWDVVVANYKESQGLKKAAEAELEQAHIAVQLAERDINTANEAVKAAQATLDDANERLKETTILSPVSGMVLERNIQIGTVVTSGKTMFTGGTILMKIADVSEIYAVVNVDEADIGQVRELAPASARPGVATQPVTMPAGMLETGEPVEVTVESFKDEKFNGLIERISPQSEVVQAIATFKVWIRITSETRDKLVGLLNTQAEAHFTAKSVRNAILVSYDAIQKDPDSEAHGVYVPEVPPGKTQPEPKFKLCDFGDSNGIYIEVRKGLKEGDVVYTKLPQKTRREKEAEDKAE